MNLSRRKERVVTTKVTGTGSATTSGAIVIPNESGELYKVEIIVADSTIANVDGATYNLDIDGKRFAEGEPAILQSALWGVGHDVGYRVSGNGGSKVGYDFINDQATAIVFYIRLFLINDPR